MRIVHVPGSDGPHLCLHGGAGGRIRELDDARIQEFADGLASAHAAGEQVLAGGGDALSAVCAAVAVMEDNPLFNAGRGAALTLDGVAEHDASVMTGDGRSGAVIATRTLRHPVEAARAVRDTSPHVLLVSPPASWCDERSLERVDPAWFVTEARRTQLERVRANTEKALRHGTVGAVAVDASGALAAATSTGGISGQATGRVGDSPIVGAGTWADRQGLAISCTGDGEAFLASCLAHDVNARVRWAGMSAAEAIESAFAEGIDARGASGGLVTVAADGAVTLAHSSPMMLAAHRDVHGELQIWA